MNILALATIKVQVAIALCMFLGMCRQAILSEVLGSDMLLFRERRRRQVYEIPVSRTIFKMIQEERTAILDG